MGETDERDLARMKIFPRNLTAYADSVVRGNPASTRPESGVGNCYPGLEFDQRNIDKAFFPGLLFEFHRLDGVILRALAPLGAPAKAGLTPADVRATLYLWAVLGSTERSTEEDMPLQSFDGLDGLAVWSRVRDLGPGRVAILIGPSPGSGAQIPMSAVDAMSAHRTAGTSRIERDPKNGRLKWAVLVGERARVIDRETGVIDSDLYSVGDLTRSLCVPWQYDFRDCGCFYWASNKPDLVTSSDGSAAYLNFQRKERSATPDVPPKDRRTWIRSRREAELDYADLIQGRWNDLPMVINDRESETFAPPGAPRPATLMSKEKVVEELEYLATVEHALSVEYLYAHYSLKSHYVPAEALLEDLPNPFDPARFGLPEMDDWERRIFMAAHEILRVGVDEMRHLHWVNEALVILGGRVSVDRAAVIGKKLQRKFGLHPLTPEQLDWFIEVEEPSQAVDEGIDGMYVWILRSITDQPTEFPQPERLIQLVKLIIDEGGGHYQRFVSIKNALKGMKPSEYLRDVSAPVPAALQAHLETSDLDYATVLAHLSLSFQVGERSGGDLLNQARRAMFNMHELNHFLARKGVLPRFTLPAAPPPAITRIAPQIATRAIYPDAAGRQIDPKPALAQLDRLSASLSTALAAARGAAGAAADPGEQDLLLRHRQESEQIFARTKELLAELAGGA